MEKNAGANRVALIGIIVQNQDSAESVNSLLHLNRQFIVGRMGIPYREKEMSIISIALEDGVNSRFALFRILNVWIRDRGS